MSLASPQSSASRVTVRFDVIGWDADQNDGNEANIQKLREYIVAAVEAGLDSIDISEDLFDYPGALFEHVDVDRANQADGSVIVSVVAIASDSNTRFSAAEDAEVPASLRA